MNKEDVDINLRLFFLFIIVVVTVCYGYKDIDKNLYPQTFVVKSVKLFNMGVWLLGSFDDKIIFAAYTALKKSNAIERLYSKILTFYRALFGLLILFYYLCTC